MLEENHFEFSFLIFWFAAVYLPVIKHGMLENLPAIVRCFSPSKTHIHWVRGFSIAIFDCRNMLSQIIPLYPQVTDDFQWFPIVQQPYLITPQRGVSGKSMKIHENPPGCYGVMVDAAAFFGCFWERTGRLHYCRQLLPSIPCSPREITIYSNHAFPRMVTPTFEYNDSP